MASSDENVKNDKLTIFTSENQVDPPEIREYIIEHWDEISVRLENSTVLFIGGVHGGEDGAVGDEDKELWRSMENQVSFHKMNITYILIKSLCIYIV